jgi:YrbI family 3-deoxy-D-manno-octulosonate 8-phosphate phosphatase
MKKTLFKNIELVVFDFDGVFTNNKVIVDENGKESVICDRSDGLGVERMVKAGIAVLVLSSEVNNVVTQRAKKLKINCINACDDKIAALRKEAKQRNISLSQIAYVGNDINDIECLKAVGFPIVVADSCKEIIGYARYKTKLKGGNGAVREICDLIYHSKKGR